LSQEVQRLNNVLKVKVDEITHFQQKIHSASVELDESRRKLQDYELKFNQLNRELELSRESYQKSAQFEIENLKRRISELENYNGQYETKIHEYEETVRSFYRKEEQFSGQFNDTQRRIA
jgi:chromosome segregation ATPase